MGFEVIPFADAMNIKAERKRKSSFNRFVSGISTLIRRTSEIGRNSVTINLNKLPSIEEETIVDLIQNLEEKGYIVIQDKSDCINNIYLEW